jgi:hypothetical protein
MSLASIWSVAMLLAAGLASRGAEWGTLKGRFVVDGPPPARAPLNVGSDQYCIGQKPLDETVVVGEKGALANVAVYLYLARGQTVEIHPDYAELAKKPVELDNKDCHFVPHVTLLRTGQPLVVKNSDPMGHNTNLAGPTDDLKFNEVIPAGGELQKTLSRANPLPMPVSCNIHFFMKAHLLVLDHPYMAASDANGAFEIKNVPAGSRSFNFWHEGPGYLRDLKVGSGTTDRRGRVELSIKAGETLDLGEIRVPVAALR